jgi:hypothetical protein
MGNSILSEWDYSLWLTVDRTEIDAYAGASIKATRMSFLLKQMAQ